MKPLKAWLRSQKALTAEASYSLAEASLSLEQASESLFGASKRIEMDDQRKSKAFL